MSSPSNSFKPFAVVIKNHYHPTYSLRIMIESADTTIGKLKTQIEQEHKGNPLIQDQLLVYRGKLLESKTNMFQLLQSSIIKTKSTSPTNNTTSNNTTSTTPQSMYIHMTLRGGSETASKIGLKPDAPPQNESKTESNKPSTTNKFSKSDSNINEEEKSTSQIPITNSAPARPIPRQFSSPYSHSMTMPPHYPPPPIHTHYPPIPPPNAYYFSHSMPDLYHPHQPYLHRTQSTPNPSQPFALPTLVQQTSNTQRSHRYSPNMSPNMQPHMPSHMPPHMQPRMPPPYGYYGHYMPMNMPPHMPPHMPPPQPFGVRSHSTSDLKYMRNRKNKRVENVKDKIDKIDEKDEKKNENDDINNDNNNNNNERMGLRQRRGPNVVNNNDNNNNNNNNNVNVLNNNNNNVNNNNNIQVQGEGWIAWFFRILNINILIRLGIFMWLFGPNLGTYRFTILCIAGGFYYLYQIGIIQRIFGRFMRGNGNRNEARHRDPNANNNNESNDNNNTEPLLPLGYVQLLQRFLIGIVFSLWPTWDHRNVYPINNQ